MELTLLLFPLPPVALLVLLDICVQLELEKFNALMDTIRTYRDRKLALKCLKDRLRAQTRTLFLTVRPEPGPLKEESINAQTLFVLLELLAIRVLLPPAVLGSTALREPQLHVVKEIIAMKLAKLTLSLVHRDTNAMIQLLHSYLEQTNG